MVERIQIQYLPRCGLLIMRVCACTHDTIIVHVQTMHHIHAATVVQEYGVVDEHTLQLTGIRLKSIAVS